MADDMPPPTPPAGSINTAPTGITSTPNTDVNVSIITNTIAAPVANADSSSTSTSSVTTVTAVDPEQRRLAHLRMRADIESIKLGNKIIEKQIKTFDENWFKSYWRPAAGWLYMLICFMDFVGFPVMVMFLPIFSHDHGVTVAYTQWVPLTLTNGGIFHVAFGAILGVAAWTRGQETLKRLDSPTPPIG